jgi:hypothetical protein
VDPKSATSSAAVTPWPPLTGVPGEPAPPSVASQVRRFQSLHAALQAALDIMAERAQAARRLAAEALKNDRKWLALEYEHKAWETDRHAALIRDLLLRDA